MIVLRSTYNKLWARYTATQADNVALHAKCAALLIEHRKLTKRWNDLVEVVNERGGQSYLDGPARGTQPLTKEDIRKMLLLCHPDKHDGSHTADEITRKLLKLRKTL